MIVIVGPTASGKSSLAITLAKRFNGEIISADSRQVYRGLEIGSGAVTEKEMGNVPHHLIGFVNPKKVFTVAEYKRKARKEIKRIWKKNKIPILVGGTGLYIRAAVDGLVIPEVKPNLRLRKMLERKPISELSQILKKMDGRRWREIDKKNPRRLIRAIEIAAALGKVPELRMDPLKAGVLSLGISKNREDLRKAVRMRVRKMIRQGLIKETKKLIQAGVKEDKIREFGFEYSDTLDFITGKIGSKAELVESIVKNTLKYAKRQMTWFKREERIMWVKDQGKAMREIKKFMEQNSKTQMTNVKSMTNA